MSDTGRDGALEKARVAARQGNLAAMHAYYALCLTANPGAAEQGAVLEEYLQRSRALNRAPGKIADVVPDGALNLNRLLPAQAPAKQLESALERLKDNALDLDAVHRLAKGAVASGWHGLAVVALADVLKHSPVARTAGSKLQRELKILLGKEYYALKEYAQTLQVLKDFQDDPATPKDVLQMLKDAAAAQASATFMKHDKAFSLATAPSVAMATKSQAEREEDELAGLEAVLADKQTENAKLVPAALRLAELLGKMAQYDRALTWLAEVEARTGAIEIAKRTVELALRKRNAQIDTRRVEAVRNPALRESVAALEIERDEFLLQAYGGLVKRMPTDGELRLRLGEAFFARWKRVRDERVLKDAIVQFQFEYKNDEHAYRARLLLAECFLALELPGAAEVVLANFLAQLDGTKKDSVWYTEAQYLLGIVRERLGDEKGATAAYLAVIGRDIAFKDAFERLRALNGKPRGGTVGVVGTMGTVV